MDETIVVKGEHNDRRRTIIISENRKKKIQEYEEERYIRELEKKVKKQQKISLIKTLPIAIAGKTFITLYDTHNGIREDKEEVGSKLNIDEYDGDFTTKPINRAGSAAGRDEKERRVIIDKTTGKKTIIYLPKENSTNLLEDIFFPKEENEDTFTLDDGTVITLPVKG